MSRVRITLTIPQRCAGRIKVLHAHPACIARLQTGCSIGTADGFRSHRWGRCGRTRWRPGESERRRGARVLSGRPRRRAGRC